MAWKFYLANSNDLSHIGELQQARSKSLTVIQNRPGSFSFTHPMVHEMAALIEPRTTCVKAYRQSSTGSWQCVWSGPVWTIQEAVSEERMTVNCVGWFEVLNQRLLRLDKQYVNQDDGTIVQDLLAEANKTLLPDFTDPTYTVPIPAGSTPNTPTRLSWGGKLSNYVGGPAYSNAVRNYNVQKYASIGQTIQQLTEIENGLDWYIDPETRAFYVYRRRSEPTTQVFGYNWGPANIQQFNRDLDASAVVNMITVFGAPGSTPGYSDTALLTPDTRTTYGLVEEVTTLSGVPIANSNGVLQAYAAGEILVRASPRVIYTITPFPYTIGNSVPEPFVDYDVGDSFLLTAVLLPRISIQGQRVRVFGITVTIDEEGNEKLGALQTSPGG